LSEFALIEVLLFGLSSEYSSNPFMQDWFSQNAWPLGYLLGNYVAPLIGIAIRIVGLAVQNLLKRRSMTQNTVEMIVPIAETV